MPLPLLVPLQLKSLKDIGSVQKRKMVSSDASAFGLQMNWRRLVPMLLLLMLCAQMPIVFGARNDYDTSTIVNKYSGVRKSQQKQQLHHHHPKQERRTNDARSMTSKSGEGGVGGEGEGGGGAGSCEDLRDIQSAVIRVMNGHYEYDQAILVMHDSIETIRKDISQLRKKIDSVAHGTWNAVDRGPPSSPLLKPLTGKTPAGDVSPAVQGSVPVGAAAFSAGDDAAGLGVPLAFAPSPPSLTVRLDNLTFIVDRQTRRLVQLDKRLRRMRHTSTAPVSGGHHEEQRPLRHTASGPEKTELERERVRLREKENELEKEREKQKEKEKELENERERQREADMERQRQREADVEAERQRQRREELMVLRCEREMELTRELTRKQREINANVQRKMQLLEKMMQENAQQRDVSYNHLTSPPQLLVNGVCPIGFMRYLSSCYLFENVTANWIDAEKRCQALHYGAHLVSIDNDDEEEFLVKYRSYNNARWSSRYLWIGANDMALEGRWSWVANGADIGYSNWRRGEPSNYKGEQHCAYLQTTDGGRAATQRNSAAAAGGGDDGRWDDWHCQTARINFACEIVIR